MKVRNKKYDFNKNRDKNKNKNKKRGGKENYMCCCNQQLIW